MVAWSPFNTIQQAVNSWQKGDAIHVAQELITIVIMDQRQIITKWLTCHWHTIMLLLRQISTTIGYEIIQEATLK